MMKSSTDLNQLKSSAKSLLYIDVSETELSPMIVKHPYTDSAIVAINNDNGYKLANILENYDALIQWQGIMSERIENAKSAIEIYCLITKPYKLAFLEFAAKSLSSDDFSEILADAWISSEASNDDLNLNKKNLLSMFKSASILGHSDVAFTMNTYVHATKKLKTTAADKMEAAFQTGYSSVMSVECQRKEA